MKLLYCLHGGVFMMPRHAVCIAVLITITVIVTIVVVSLIKKKYCTYKSDVVGFGFALFGALIIALGGFTQITLTTVPSYCKSNLDFINKEIGDIQQQIDTEQDPDSKWYLENIILEKKIKVANYYRRQLGMEVEND